jgi:hypothetical protein
MSFIPCRAPVCSPFEIFIRKSAYLLISREFSSDRHRRKLQKKLPPTIGRETAGKLEETG